LHLGHQLLYDLTIYKTRFRDIKRGGGAGRSTLKVEGKKPETGKYSRAKEAQTGQLF
jgi:hypothetical protein